MKNRGMTLLETLAAMAIAAVLVGLVSMPFTNVSPRYKLLRAVREIHSRLNYARYRAIFKGTKVKVQFDKDGYRVETYDPLSSRWIGEPKCFLSGVDIEANNAPVFHPMGTVSDFGTIHIGNSWAVFKITLAISGRIKVVRLEPPMDP